MTQRNPYDPPNTPNRLPSTGGAPTTGMPSRVLATVFTFSLSLTIAFTSSVGIVSSGMLSVFSTKAAAVFAVVLPLTIGTMLAFGAWYLQKQKRVGALAVSVVTFAFFVAGMIVMTLVAIPAFPIFPSSQDVFRRGHYVMVGGAAMGALAGIVATFLEFRNRRKTSAILVGLCTIGCAAFVGLFLIFYP